MSGNCKAYALNEQDVAILLHLLQGGSLNSPEKQIAEELIEYFKKELVLE